jgi:hypothetical protein
MSILDAARDAAGAGFRAIVAKSHHHSMVGRPERRRDLDELLSFIKAVGPGRTVLASDSGQKANPLPVTLFRRAVRALLNAGVPEPEIRRMVGSNAGQLLLA